MSDAPPPPPPVDLPASAVPAELEAPADGRHDRDSDHSSRHGHRHSSSSRRRSRSRSRSRDRHRSSRHRSRSRSRSRDRYKPYSQQSSSKTYASRSFSRDDYERSRSDHSGGRDRRRSRSRSRSRERRRETERTAEREQRREREENDKMYGVQESERGIRTLFVRNMPLKASEKDIAEFFGTLGCKVREIQLIKDNKTKKSKGLGYIEFYERDACDRAAAMNGAEFWGKRIEMEPQTVDQETGVQITLASSLGPNKLLVNQLHYAITQDMIREIYSIYGELERVDLQFDEVGMSKGTAIVQFKSADVCKVALEETNGIEVAGRPLRVSLISDTRTDTLMTPSMSMQMAPMAYESERLEEEGHVKTAQQRAQLIARLQSAESSHNMSQLTGLGSQVSLPLPSTTGQVSTIGGYVPQSATGVLGVPSPCIVLKNMFNPAEETNPDFDAEIAQDVSEECSQYGRVLHVHVDKNSLGFVYLRFETAQAAVQAGQALHGRWFAGRMVSAEYIPPIVYEAQFPASRSR